MNIALAQRVHAAMDSDPRAVNMNIWGYRDGNGHFRGCIGGHAMILSGYTVKALNEFLRPDGSRVTSAHAEAHRLLGISSCGGSDMDNEAGCLFWVMDSGQALSRFASVIELEQQAAIPARLPRRIMQRVRALL